MPQPFRTTRRVEFCETDMAGIAHFANFYIYMEQAEHEMFRALGLKLIDHQPDGTVISFPRVSASCSFSGPARYDDVLDVTVAVDRVGVKSLTLGVEFHLDGKRIAHGQLKTVYCHFRPEGKMTSIEIPPDVREKLERFAGDGG